MNNEDIRTALTFTLKEEVSNNVGYLDERAEVVIGIIVDYLMKRINTAIVQFFLRRY